MSDVVTSIIFEPLIPVIATFKLKITTICQCKTFMKSVKLFYEHFFRFLECVIVPVQTVQVTHSVQVTGRNLP